MTAELQQASETRPADVAFRCAVLFVAAYAINGTLHEAAHALTAYAAGVPSTLFHFYADVSHASERQRAVISCAGPAFSLVFGAFFLLAYHENQRSPNALLFFYLAVFGISIFLGNLFAISFVGDFSRAAALLGLHLRLRYVVTMFAALLLATFMFFVGRELANWGRPGESRITAAVALVIVPVVIGTLLIVAAYMPMPTPFVVSTFSSSTFWIFAIPGVLVADRRRRESRRMASLQVDIGIALAAVIAVRLLVLGIPFTP